MAACATCGKGLSLGDRARGRTVCGDCQAKADDKRRADAAAAEAVRAAQNQAFQMVADAAIQPGADFVSIRARSEAVAASGLVSYADMAAMCASAVERLLTNALADGLLTDEEETRITQVGPALLMTQGEFTNVLSRRADDVVVARLNAGRLTQIADPMILLKRGELAYYQTQATLLKDVAVREFRGGSSGVSFRVAKGVRVHTGNFRGHSVVTGHQMIPADRGSLCVTSLRAVFSGGIRTMEMPYTKVIDLRGFSDGVQFHLSNRQAAPIFQVPNGPLLLATISAAVAQAT